MNDWPEPSSTVVSARRVVSAGTRKPFSVTAACVVELADLRTDAHRDAAVGQHDRRESEADAILLILDRDARRSPCEIGIGNSPPARKLAVSPERAVRFGSARIVATPSFAARSSVPSRSRPRRCAEQPASVVSPAVATDVPKRRRSIAAVCGMIVPGLPRPMPNWKPPVVSLRQQVDAHRLEQRPVDLGDADLQHDLQRRRRLQAGDHLRALADIGLGQALRFGDVVGIGDGAGEQARGCSSASPGCSHRALPDGASRRAS